MSNTRLNLRVTMSSNQRYTHMIGANSLNAYKSLLSEISFDQKLSSNQCFVLSGHDVDF